MPLLERAVHLNLDVGVSNTRILADNRYRRYALIVNDSNVAVYIALGITAELNKGIRLNSLGGSYEINLTNPYYGEIYAITSAATKRLMITELSNAA